MRAEIRSLDIDGQSLSDALKDEGETIVNVAAGLGPEGQDGCEYFQFTVASIDGLCDMVADANAPVFLGKAVVLAELNARTIREALEKVCRSVEADTWPEVATKLSRLSLWEFADYVESAD